MNDICEGILAGGDRPKDTSEIRTKEYPYPVFANAATNEGLLCFSRNYKIDKPCVTIAARGCTVGFTAIRNERFTPVVRLISLIPKNEITPMYLKYFIDKWAFSLLNTQRIVDDHVSSYMPRNDVILP